MQIIPSFLVDKASCTRQFESEFSLHSLASLSPIKEGIFSNPSVSLSKGSSTSNQAFLLRRKDVNRPTRCSEPLRSKVGGASKPSPWLCGMGPPGCYGDQLAIILLKVSAWRGACRLSPPELFLIAVSLCTCRRSNEEYYFYSTFDRITSGEVPIRVMAEIL